MIEQDTLTATRRRNPGRGSSLRRCHPSGAMIQRVVCLLASLAACLAATESTAASARFFWAGVHAPELRPEVRSVLRAYVEREFGSKQAGSFGAFMRQIKFKKLTYYGAGADALEAFSEDGVMNFRNVYGAYLSLDRILEYPGTESRVLGIVQATTYVVGAVNIFHVDTRNIVHSRPFLLATTAPRLGDRPKPDDIEQFLTLTLGTLSERLKDKSDRHTTDMRDSLQAYFGARGEDQTARLRRAGGLQDTYGISHAGSVRIIDADAPLPAGDSASRPAVEVDPTTKPLLQDHLLYSFSHRLSLLQQVTPPRTQQQQVTGVTLEIKSSGSQGDVERDYTSDCKPRFSDSGTLILCVQMPAPRNRVHVDVRFERRSTKKGRIQYFAYTAYVDFRIDYGDGRETRVAPTLRGNYEARIARTTLRPSEHHYAVALTNAITSLDREAFDATQPEQSAAR